MKRLVVLVGLPGSGKTAIRDRHPEWAVVSKDAIRRGVFGRSHASEHEDVVDRVFAATLVEVIGSDAEVVCVDDLNLTRASRHRLIELAQLAGRRPIAYVMPSGTVDELLARAGREARRLSALSPSVRVDAPSRGRLDDMIRSYEPVDEREGFLRVQREAAFPETEIVRPPKPPKRKRVERREPLPLFVP